MDNYCHSTEGTPDRSRLVLEAQAFNLLTDREKRNFVAIGAQYDHDILLSIHAAIKDKLVADDGKPIMNEKRFKTFKSKYDGYKTIYEKNKKYLKFANWYFERKYLGYAFSNQLKNVFDNSERLMNSKELQNAESRSMIKFVGVIKDSIIRTSANGNRYMKLEIQDDFGQINFLLTNNAREDKLNKYIDDGGRKPKENEIVFITGSKGDDVIFGENVSILDEKIYVKLSEVK
jgi:DNA polymerase III alpha subunit